MTAVYCPSTLTSMRDMARRGATVEELALRLDWHPSAVDRICARHGIEIAGGDPDADLQPPVVPEPPFRGFIAPSKRQTVRAHVTNAASAAIHQAAHKRGLTVSRLCADILEAAVERGL